MTHKIKDRKDLILTKNCSSNYYSVKKMSAVNTKQFSLNKLSEANDHMEKSSNNSQSEIHHYINKFSQYYNDHGSLKYSESKDDSPNKDSNRYPFFNRKIKLSKLKKLPMHKNVNKKNFKQD
eukprot:GHVR01041127.1.p1 GENE.GHVR01041127.1~~GHVR01041127.1.p1  ORF type:complete len:122 (+),score=2.89 GHVR01041127.1:164-529(+)